MKSNSCADRLWQMLRTKKPRQITTLYKTVAIGSATLPFRRKQQVVGGYVARINKWLRHTKRPQIIKPGEIRRTYRLYDL